MPRPTYLAFLIVAVAIHIVFPHSCNAQLRYHFAREATGTLLARLELAKLPATHQDIVALTFSPEGQATFGYGPVYLGTFDLTLDSIHDAGIDGLTGGLIHDNDAIDSSLQPLGTSTLALDFGSLTTTPDVIILSSVEPREVPSIVVRGNWLLAPEPNSLLMATVTGGSLLIFRQRRRKD